MSQVDVEKMMEKARKYDRMKNYDPSIPPPRKRPPDDSMIGMNWKLRWFELTRKRPK